MKRGPTRAIRRPMMTITTIISMSVKPALALRRDMRHSLLHRQIVHAEDRRKHRDHDEADSEAHDEDEHGLEEPGELLDLDAKLAVAVFRGAQQHLVESAGLLADRHHLHPERWKDARAG